VWDCMVSVNEGWERDDFDMVEVIDANDNRLVARFRRTVPGKASGIADEFDYWWFGRFHAGKVLSQAWFSSRAEALEADGSRE
jgi:hypothetical protein